MYPMLRDSYGVPAGTVTPGDVMRLDEAPDADWVPYEAGDAIPAASEPAAEAMAGQGNDEAGTAGSEES